MTLRCAEVEELLDAFVDAELPGPTLLAIARHAGGCPPCDQAIQGLEALRQVVGEAGNAAADALDLSSVWPAVAAEVERADARRRWQRRVRAVRAPLWGALAIAAAAVLFLRSAPVDAPTARSDGPRTRTVATRPNQASVDRLVGKSVRLRREPRTGTMMIWVSDTSGGTIE